MGVWGRMEIIPVLRVGVLLDDNRISSAVIPPGLGKNQYSVVHEERKELTVKVYTEDVQLA